MFCVMQNSGIEKAFLFDVVSKIYIATDRYYTGRVLS